MRLLDVFSPFDSKSTLMRVKQGDSTLTLSSRWSANNSFMEKNINEEHVVNWSKMNKMVISKNKTKSVLAVGRRLRKRLDSTDANQNVSSNGATNY